MTENEAKEILLQIAYDGEYPIGSSEAFSIAIQALEEIQQYRAIGTVEELKSMKENGAFTGVELAQLAAMQMRLKEYSAIGTIEEFKALKEKEELFDRNIKMFESIGLKIRQKTIDEFVERLKKHEQENWIDYQEYGITWADIEEIAEEMRGAE